MPAIRFNKENFKDCAVNDFLVIQIIRREQIDNEKSGVKRLEEKNGVGDGELITTERQKAKRLTVDTCIRKEEKNCEDNKQAALSKKDTLAATRSNGMV